MSNFLKLFQFFPYVLAAVVGVEAAATGQPGSTKKQIVLSSILGVAKIGEQVPIPIVGLISGLIDSVVTALNASGVFNHGTPPAVAPTAPTVAPAAA